MRNFRVNGIKIRIVNRYTAGMEINSFNQKYDVMMFNTAYNAWTRLCSCMTIAEGKEIAIEKIETMQELAIHNNRKEEKLNMLNEEQINKAGLLHKIQFAVETVDVSKFYEAIILYSMEYKCEVPTETAKLVEAQERKVSQDKLKQLMQEIAIPVINNIKTNGEWE